jgi:hypothetical protein
VSLARDHRRDASQAPARNGGGAAACLVPPLNFWVLPGPPCIAGIARARWLARYRIFSSLIAIEVNRSAAHKLKSHGKAGALRCAAVNALSQHLVKLTPQRSFAERRSGPPPALGGAR